MEFEAAAVLLLQYLYMVTTFVLSSSFIVVLTAVDGVVLGEGTAVTVLACVPSVLSVLLGSVGSGGHRLRCYHDNPSHPPASCLHL